MGIVHMNSLYIETRSFDKSQAFWEALGFRLAAEWSDEGHKAGRLEAGPCTIILVEDESPEVTVHFRIDDADSYVQRVAARSAVRVETPLERTHWGTRWMRVQDPDGNTFVLQEPAKRPDLQPGEELVTAVYDVAPGGIPGPLKIVQPRDRQGPSQY
jgi:catechol 2,3-dioxygenase-like lactoylglutathione lyase family enzyme